MLETAVWTGYRCRSQRVVAFCTSQFANGMASCDFLESLDFPESVSHSMPARGCVRTVLIEIQVRILVSSLPRPVQCLLAMTDDNYLTRFQKVTTEDEKERTDSG